MMINTMRLEIPLLFMLFSNFLAIDHLCSLIGQNFQVSGEIPCVTPDNQSVQTSGPLGPSEKNVSSSPYIDPRQPGN